MPEGYNVSGSTTSSEKLHNLVSSGIEGYIIKLSTDGITGNIEMCLNNCRTLIINIPPGLRKDPKKNYVQQLKHLIPYIELGTIKNIIFISSTSIYNDDVSIPRITELSPTSSLPSARQLINAEVLFKDNKHFNTTILRLSGLYGNDRHPANYLSGKTDIKNPNAPVNLIHQTDCILIILSIIEQGIWNETFNASTTHHSRLRYYTSICKTKGLLPPKFDMTRKSEGKIIDSSKLEQILGYRFKVKL